MIDQVDALLAQLLHVAPGRIALARRVLASWAASDRDGALDVARAILPTLAAIAARSNPIAGLAVGAAGDLLPLLANVGLLPVEVVDDTAGPIVAEP